MNALTSELKTQLALVAAVSASHMSMPNYWLPYSLVARAQNWSLRKAIFLTFLGAFGHVSVTLLLMLAISEIGASLISESMYRLLSTSVLLLGGLYYLHTYMFIRRRDSCCDPNKSSQSVTVTPADTPVVHKTAALSLILLTTLTPCVGSMPVLLAVLSPPIQLTTVLFAGATLLASAAGVMMTLVTVSYLSAATLDFAKVRRHERLILGVALVVLALFTFFVFSKHDHAHHGQDMAHVHAHEHGMMESAAHEGMAHMNEQGESGAHDGHHHQNHDGLGGSLNSLLRNTDIKPKQEADVR